MPKKDPNTPPLLPSVHLQRKYLNDRVSAIFSSIPRAPYPPDSSELKRLVKRVQQLQNAKEKEYDRLNDKISKDIDKWKKWIYEVINFKDPPIALDCVKALEAEVAKAYSKKSSIKRGRRR